MSPLYLKLKEVTHKARLEGRKTELSVGSVIIGDVETEMKRTGQDITDEAFIKRARKLIDANQDMINLLKDPQRIETLKAEIHHLESLLPELPKPLSEVEIEQIVKDSGLAHIREIMPFLQKHYKGRFDGKKAKTIVNKVLNQ